ncbi:MAG: isoleucine--tRNA ligase [bacterium]|nr:isoleucine--tRNA ligase [bacterium]
MDYRDTLNLPKTDFKMKANLPNKEPEIEKYWEDSNIYQKIRDISKGRTKYILHDGPPYANGDIHMGHALNKILKDIIVKYKSMSGYDTPYIPGWDCHGLPIEYKVMQDLTKERDLTPEKIRQKCKDYAHKYINIQRKQFKRLGILGDWQKPYLTLDNDYCAMVIEVFGKIVEEGYVYKGIKPVYWCSDCKTALAEAEVEYREKNSPSIFVRFPMQNKGEVFKNITQPLYVIIWTTTPWTLLANVAIALHPEYSYVTILMTKNGHKCAYILAEERLPEILNTLRIDDYKIIQRNKGKDLEGLSCVHPFIERESKLVLANYVTLEEGSGCVHTAPGHGLEDYETGVKYQLPIISPVDDEGKFTSEAFEFKGLGVFKANKEICQKLKDLEHLLHYNTITHSYPHCWRCKNPVIFRATKQWFISMEIKKLKERVLKATEQVNWIPEWGKNRFYGMVENRGEWCISRQRSWGVPIPVFYCKDCQNYILSAEKIYKVRDIVNEEGIEVWFEKDAYYFLPKGEKCSDCGSTNIDKENDIIDVWFESGVSHEAVLRKRDNLSWPADMYLEGSDQHRGWFQSSMLTAISTCNVPPYKAVLTHGFMLDSSGKAMSKSLGNVISPQEITSTYGADILRLWVCSLDYRGDVSLGKENLERMVEAYRKIRNTCRFILGNIYDFNPDMDSVSYNKLLSIDRWILSKLQVLIEKTTSSFKDFEFYNFYHLLNNFCVVTLSSFYFDIIKDRLYTYSKESMERRAAQTCIHKILIVLVKLMAPILSFTSEEIWKCLLYSKAKKESVHLTSWPKIQEEYKDTKIEEEYENLLLLREEVLKKIEEIRAKGIIGHSLEVSVHINLSLSNKELLKKYEKELEALFIVSKVQLYDSLKEEIGIKVEKIKGNKCERCWNYKESVGDNKEMPNLCKRCIDVVKEFTFLKKGGI